MFTYIRQILFAMLLVIAGYLLTSCEQSMQKNTEGSLARVGSEYLTIQQARDDIPDYVLAEDSLNALKQYRDSWVRQQLLLQEATRLGLHQKPEIQKKIEQARNEVLRQALKDYVLANSEKNLSATDEQARSYYQKNKDQFVLEEDFVRYRHMRTETMAEARNARQDLLGGVPWPEVVQKYSLEPSKALSEADQYWPISMAAQGIDVMNRYLNVIGQSEISPIQRVNGVYHFVQLMDTKAEGNHPDLNWLTEQIKNWLTLNNRQRNLSSFIKNLYLKAESNNEVETFNVLSTKSNQNTTVQDTLENTSSNE